MQRRNFLQALLAAGSALAGARAVTAAVASPESAKAVAPRVTVAANTQPLRRNLDEAQRTVMEMLKECRVLRLEESVGIRAASLWRVTYRHDPDAPRTSLDDEADRIVESRPPVSVLVSSYEREVDIVSLGGSFYKTPLTKPTYEIQVEYR
jgi:hypothetical protein